MKTTRETIYCGIDIHSKNSYFSFLDKDGKQRQLIEIGSKKEEIEKLIGQYRDCSMQYAFEAGGMSRYFWDILSVQNNTKKVHVVHPLKFKLITESKKKNDKNDCQHLAEGLLKNYLPLAVHMKSQKARQLQLVLNLREAKVKYRSKLIIQAKSIIRSLGIKLITVNICSERAFQKMVNCIPEELFEKGIVSQIKNDFTHVSKAILEIENQIKTLLAESFQKDYEILNTIPGIGLITSSWILCTVDNISRFETADKFSDYCGLVPSEHSSGGKIQHGRITKQGVKQLRVLLIQAAWCLIRKKQSNDPLKEDMRLKGLKKKFQKISMKTKNIQKAITAIARHVSRIVFGVLKHQMPYSGIIVNPVTQKA